MLLGLWDDFQNFDSMLEFSLILLEDCFTQQNMDTTTGIAMMFCVLTELCVLVVRSGYI